MQSYNTQLIGSVQDIIDDEIDLYSKDRKITKYKNIPSTSSIPIENKLHWLKIEGVICIFVDMIGSTLLSAEKEPHICAKIYHLFSDTITRIFHYYDAQYIDIHGDGVFALFNQDQLYRSFAAAVTVKTFIETHFEQKVRRMERHGAKIAIDQGTLLVRKIGLKCMDRTDRQNELWAGKPINMAAKLSSKASRGELLVSDRYYDKLKSDLVLLSCGCNKNGTMGQKEPLWDVIDLSSDDCFDFNKAHLLKSIWCETHGKEYCTNILALDS